MENEVFTLQGKEFTLKESTFERQKKLIALNKKIKKYYMANLKEYLVEMEKYSDNVKSIDYIYAKAHYDLALDEITAEYYCNEQNLKEIFELLLEGDLNNIDYNGNADELINVANTLSTKFFFTSKQKQES